LEKIKFGTDGWRGIIADNFTFKNVKIVSQAIADYFHTVKHTNKNIIIGYDLRFMGEKYAELIARVLSGNGFNVFLSDKAITTPVVSFSVINQGALGGIMVTASHNPSIYNGIKIKKSTGCSPTPEETRKIEGLLSYSTIRESGNYIKKVSLEQPYFDKLKAFVNLKKIKESKFKVMVEPMWGSSAGYLLEILKGSKLELLPIHHFRDVNFGGVQPEPLEHNLKEAIKAVKKEKPDVCLVADGDGDRVGLIDNTGKFYSAQHIIPLVMLHLLDNKKWTGEVIKTNATSSAVAAIAKEYNLKLHETPIGFKYIADLMVKEDILIGGEESGGIGVKNYIPERDGVLNGLLILEMMSEAGKNLKALMKDVEKRFGVYCYDRVDIHYAPDKKDKMFELLKTVDYKEIRLTPIKEITRFDGTKFIFEDNGWLLLRASGTEPVLRIYSEASSIEKVREYLEFGKELANSL